MFSEPSRGPERKPPGSTRLTWPTHLRVRNQRGVMLLDDVKSQTPLYALDQENSAGYPNLSMTPIY